MSRRERNTWAARGIGVIAGYLFIIRPWHLSWGATEEEIGRPMPLDDRVAKPTYVTNRAVTIHASPQAIWPWLAQMGELPRGGFYSYEWVERRMGMRVKNAERILPEFQRLSVGDALDRNGNMLVKALEPNRHLVLGPPEGMPWGESTWALALYPIGSTATRLVSRVRGRIRRTRQGLFWLALLDPGQFIMERKMLLEIKRRAEQPADDQLGKEAPGLLSSVQPAR